MAPRRYAQNEKTATREAAVSLSHSKDRRRRPVVRLSPQGKPRESVPTHRRESCVGARGESNAGRHRSQQDSPPPRHPHLSQRLRKRHGTGQKGVAPLGRTRTRPAPRNGVLAHGRNGCVGYRRATERPRPFIHGHSPDGSSPPSIPRAINPTSTISTIAMIPWLMAPESDTRTRKR